MSSTVVSTKNIPISLNHVNHRYQQNNNTHLNAEEENSKIIQASLNFNISEKKEELVNSLTSHSKSLEPDSAENMDLKIKCLSDNNISKRELICSDFETSEQIDLTGTNSICERKILDQETKNVLLERMPLDKSHTSLVSCITTDNSNYTNLPSTTSVTVAGSDQDRRTSELIKKQINEIEKEISRRIQNKNIKKVIIILILRHVKSI